MRTFLDSGVLIAAARGTGTMGTRALAVFNDPARVFLSSEFVRMEVLPKAIYYKRAQEIGFYEDFFTDVDQLVPISASLAQLAYTEACQAGLSGLDALHIAAAKLGGGEEFITTEKSTHTLFRVTGLVITSIALAESL
jgi:predicted nucleic acid-binding protein